MVDRPDFADTRHELRCQVDEWWKSTGGRDLEYYESDDFRNWGQATLVSDNALWNDAATSK